MFAYAFHVYSQCLLLFSRFLLKDQGPTGAPISTSFTPALVQMSGGKEKLIMPAAGQGHSLSSSSVLSQSLSHSPQPVHLLRLSEET